ncbi:MAG: alpha/beta fold hydrolase [Alphaproteobacteria bacterium]
MTPPPDPLSGWPPFRARAPWFGGDLQTLRNTIMRDRADLDPWPGERLYFKADNGDRLNGVLHPAPDKPKTLVTLIHGLTGCEDSAYVRASARFLLEAGNTVLRLNLRGALPSRQDCRQMYHAGRSEDLALVFDELANMGYGAAQLFAVGYSLGGNILLKYLAEAGEDSRVSRAVTISTPLDLSRVSRRLEAPRNRLYHRWLLDRMKLDWRGGPLDLNTAQMDALDRADSIRNFDDGVVASSNGYADAEDYYARCAAGPRLGEVTIPTLLVHAEDDPWIPADIYRRYAPSMPPEMALALTPGGGHVGFHGKTGRWHDHAIRRFFDGNVRALDT